MTRVTRLLVAAGIALFSIGYAPEAPAQISVAPPLEAGAEYAPDEVLVRFRTGVPAHIRRALYARFGAVEHSADSRLGFRRVKLPVGGPWRSG